jgi:hypothetical protein
MNIYISVPKCGDEVRKYTIFNFQSRLKTKADFKPQQAHQYTIAYHVYVYRERVPTRFPNARARCVSASCEMPCLQKGFMFKHLVHNVPKLQQNIVCIIPHSDANQRLIGPLRYVRYGIGGAGNIAQRRTPKLQFTIVPARESSTYSRISFGDEDSDPSGSWLRHMGIGGAGNVTSKRTLSPSLWSRSSLESKRGSMISLTKGHRHIGIGGAGNVIA